MAMAMAEASRWPDLLPELLGLVLLRMPSHADRVRLRAVCRPWRSAARPLPPVLPWAALRDGTFLSLPDGAIHRMPVPDDVSHRVSTGSMLFLVHSDGRCSLMHPQSGDMTPQRVNPDWCLWPLVADNIRKVVVSDHIVAVRTEITTQPTNVTIYTRGGGGTMDLKWVPPRNCGPAAADIAFFHGKLYILIASLFLWQYDLYVLDVDDVDEQGGVRSVQCIRTTPIPRDPAHNFIRQLRFYLVVSGDRLLLVEQTVHTRVGDRTLMPSRFDVFEAADLSRGGHGRWSKVDTLMGRALFVSESCSESLPASGVGAQEDCVYFMSERFLDSYEDKVLESGIYNMRQGTTVVPLPPLAATSRDSPWPPTWLFPVDT